MTDEFFGMGGGSGEPPKKGDDAKAHPVRRDSSISLDDTVPLASRTAQPFAFDRKLPPTGQGRYNPAKDPLMPLDPQETRYAGTPPTYTQDSDVDGPPRMESRSSTRSSSLFSDPSQLGRYLRDEDSHEKRAIGLGISSSASTSLSPDTARGDHQHYFSSQRTPRATTPVGPSDRIVDSPERDMDMGSPVTAKKGDYGYESGGSARAYYFSDEQSKGTDSKQSSGRWSMANSFGDARGDESDDEGKGR